MKSDVWWYIFLLTQANTPAEPDQSGDRPLVELSIPVPPANWPHVSPIIIECAKVSSTSVMLSHSVTDIFTKRETHSTRGWRVQYVATVCSDLLHIQS